MHSAKSQSDKAHSSRDSHLFFIYIYICTYPICVCMHFCLFIYTLLLLCLYFFFFFRFFYIFTGGGITFVYGDNGIQLSQCKTFRCRRRFETETICITRLAECALYNGNYMNESEKKNYLFKLRLYDLM